MVSECHSLALQLAEPALHSIIRQDSALRLGIWASKYTWCPKAWDHSSCEWTEGRRSAWVDELIGYLLWFYSTPLSTSHPPEVIYMINGPRLSPCFCVFVLLCITNWRVQTGEALEWGWKVHDICCGWVTSLCICTCRVFSLTDVCWLRALTIKVC